MPGDNEVYGNAAAHPQYGKIDVSSGYAHRHHVETVEVCDAHRPVEPSNESHRRSDP